MELTHSIPYDGKEEDRGYQREVGEIEGEGTHPRKFSCVELIIHFLSSKFLKTVAL